ncbi:MAG: NADP-dependent isocitrate dehydrogenase, partial [Actinomycetota bacterium]
HYRAGGISVAPRPGARRTQELVGVDVFLARNESDRDPDVLGAGLIDAAPDGWRLSLVTNRGVKVFPDGLPETFRTDHWRCRFLRSDDGSTRYPEVLALLGAVDAAGFDVIKTEHLYTLDGDRSYSLGQGE